MTKLNSLDLMVSDVSAAARFFEQIVGMELKESSPRFAELVSDDFVLMLSPDALVPLEKANGIILHFEVDDVTEALRHAVEQGATVLLGHTQTDWGTQSAMIQGPEGTVIDFYKST